jgi:hypothetical protein
MNNAELIETLKAYPPEAPVTVLWEDFAESEIQAVTFENGGVLIVHDCQWFDEKGGKA